ncbi:2-isopropylmalate synthase [Synechococcus sp. PCC 7335]|uniref:2-isopropylmalate synthase n=1 Tax=Synechococcus sp. (strain ATCC 29403 / PCC 7335) TaxID=91464 RepID=UPI00017EC019|nr:2-isopropylmalate synthase [Synechococcus sp. PCC 7335]EDX84344.1 2-isopropylmalate synthase [Synechococcus sp. PCC 7335]
MLNNPSDKYAAFAPIDLFSRTWPDQTITTPPIWLSTDLRDGNQALIEPMDIGRKLRLFRTLVDIGFKEIEIGFPSASQIEFDFARHLIDHNLIPSDVTIQVLTPARESLICRTFEAVRGALNVIVHVYNATAPTFRQVVFNLDKPGTIRLATEAAELIKTIAQAQIETNWRFQYSPEVFTSTELPFAKEICNAVLDIWQPTLEAKAIINLPASVEVSTPNIFADQVEWMHRELHHREAVVLCVHPHNDRGCSVAAAELAQMAGAQRVEGCLFGNGERTGNVDLVTLAMNLYTQGISPGLDFSCIDDIVRVAEDCTQLPVHPRHPYAGELVFTAFSGSHQDAIRKGFAARSPNDVWSVPYLPMDPADVGRSYASVVRVNSQSGKGGIAFLLERDYGLSLPRKLQIEFSSVVQQAVDASGKEITAQAIWDVFCQEYQQVIEPLQYVSHRSSQSANQIETQQVSVVANLVFEGAEVVSVAQGDGPIEAFVKGLNQVEALRNFGEIEVWHYEERSLRNGSQGEAIALIEVVTDQGSSYGIGIHKSIVIASFQAIVSALNRLSDRICLSDSQSLATRA